MNLLNGLAVSDTREILEEAEMLSYKSKVNHIYHAESVLLRDVDGCGKVVEWIFRLITGNKGIQLFSPSDSEKKKTVEPNVPPTGCYRLTKVS